MTFAQTIRAYRESAGLTQAEFAAKLTVSQQTVNNWERGRFEPWPRKKEALLSYCAGSDGTNGTAASAATSAMVSTTAVDAGSGATKYVRRTRPNVCEEIAGQSASVAGSQESLARPQIDFRRPPPHNARG